MNAGADRDAACMNALLAPIVAHARRASQTVALRAGGAEVTYAGLLASAARFADALGQRGVGSDDVVALQAERTPETIALILAIVASGAAYLPLDPAQGDARLAAMLDDARPRLLVADAALRARLPAGTRCVERGELESTQAVLQPRRSGALAYVLFTSGSTGRPKGVAMRTRAVAGLLEWQAGHARLGRAARTLQFAPLGFDVSFQEIFSTLATGGTLVLPADAERRDPWALLNLLEREQIERVFLPAVALQALAEAALSERRVPAAPLADIVTAGEQLRVTPALRALFAKLPGSVLHNQYGPTETHVVTAHELHGDAADWPDLPPIGRPLPHVRLRLEPAPGADRGGEGELLIGGDCLAAGYINRPQLTAERFVDIDGERWYRSGDRARRDADGAWIYLGRLDDQLKIAGHRVEPADIEAVLCGHDEVAHAVVVATPGEAGARLVAHIVPRVAAPQVGLQQRLADHCAAALPDYLCPQAFTVHAVLPTTASGKIDRRALARSDPNLTRDWREGAPLATQLQRMWERLLGVAPLALDANLFDAGARSLTVVHALTELRRHGHVMSVAQAYEHASIAAQAAFLGSAQAPPPEGRDDGRNEQQRAAFARFARNGKQ
jgi:amino acid adenylation domain-containing protein